MMSRDWIGRRYGLIFLFFFIHVQFAWAFDLHRQLGASLRSYPMSASVRAQAKFERVVWDQRAQHDQAWKFGVFQGGVGIASHGLLEGQISFAPVSLFELGFSNSRTLRFYETSGFDCDVVYCKGDVDRETVWYRALIGHQFTSYSLFFIPMISMTNVQLSKANASYGTAADEVDRIQFAATGDQLKSETFIFGMKAGMHTVVLLQRNARYDRSQDFNRSRYLVLSEEVLDKTYSLGVGEFISRDGRQDWSAVVSVSWRPDGKMQGYF